MKRPRVKLIDDSAFLLRREKIVKPKPDAWFRSEKHLAFVRTRRCLRCGLDGPCEAAHVRKDSDGAKGVKPSDYFTVPLCPRCHKVQHTVGEVSFWGGEMGPIDPIHEALETALTQSPCPRTREAAFEEYRRRYG